MEEQQLLHGDMQELRICKEHLAESKDYKANGLVYPVVDLSLNRKSNE